MSTQKKIIIVGAGIARLAAADRLREQNFEVTLLEARNRIGGRTATDHTWQRPLDLGASWIHGSENNPLIELANKFHAHFKWTDFTKSLCYNADRKIIPSNEVNDYFKEFEKIVDTAEKQAKEGEDAPLSVLLTKLIQQQPERKKPPHLLLRQLEILCLYSGASLDRLSARHIYEEDVLPGGNFYMLDGYEPIVNGLAKDLDIKLNTLVRKIIYQENQIKIVTNQETYQCDYVIITVPLGALKRQLIQFEPELPIAKRSAIERLEMGVYDKVFIQFPEPFWPVECHTIYLSRYREQYLSIFLNEYTFSQQPVLMGIISNAKLKDIEKVGDEEIVADTMETFNYYFGNQIPQPTAYRITHWWKDPLSYGSYSFIPYGASGDDYDMLGQSVNDRLFFAGEATHRKHFATVHGAYLSGIREADRIIKMQKG